MKWEQVFLKSNIYDPFYQIRACNHLRTTILYSSFFTRVYFTAIFLQNFEIL